MAADFANIDNINDEEVLEALINQTEDLEIRRKIRRRQRNISDKKSAVYEAQRRQMEADMQEDAVTMRLRIADEEKRRKLQQFEEQAREGRNDPGIAEEALRQRHAEAEVDKQRRLEQMAQLSKTMSTVYNIGVSDVLKEIKQPPSGGVSVTVNNSSSVSVSPGPLSPGTEQAMAIGDLSLMDAPDKGKHASVAKVKGIGGMQYSLKTNATEQGPQPTGQTGSLPVARPAVPVPNLLAPGDGSAVKRNPSAIKQMLLDWCKAQVEGYPGVTMTNFSSSWADGLAFCALIHHFYPEAFDFNQLTPANRRGNFKLAFDTAEQLAGIGQLLEVEDMVRMKNPDWKCVFTYIQSYYRRFGMPPRQQRPSAEQH